MAAVGPPPIPPDLCDFGLSATGLSFFSKSCFANFFSKNAAGLNSHFAQHNEIAVYLSTYVFLWVLLLYFHIAALSIGTIIAFVFWLFFPLPALIFILAIGQIEKMLRSALDHNFRSYCEYSIAYNTYTEKQSRYESALAEHGHSIAKIREDYWRTFSGIQFEIELGKLFSLMGYAVTHTPSTSDGGIDLILHRGGKTTVVQCKAHNKPVSIGVARELYAAKMDFKADDAIIACFEGVTKPVLEYIKDKSIVVLNLHKIVELQRKHGGTLQYRVSVRQAGPAIWP